MAQDDMTNRQMFDLLMEEIGCVYKDLKEQMVDMENRLDARIDGLQGDLINLTLKVDCNHRTFMHHIDTYDKRILALETAK